MSGSDWAYRMPDDEVLAKRRRRIRAQVLSIISTHVSLAIVYVILLNLFVPAENFATSDWAISIACSIIFCVTIFSQATKYGRRDKQMMNLGHIRPDKWRGVKIAFISQIPSFVFATIAAVYMLVTSDYSGYAVFMYRVFFATFSVALMQLEQISPLMCLVPLAIVPLLYSVGYFLGMKGFIISERIVYKKPKRK